MAKKGNTGCATIIAIFLLIGIIATFSRVIGAVMIIASIAAGIYLFVNKDVFRVFSGLKKTGLIAGLLSLILFGFALALPSEEVPTSNTPSTQIAEQNTKEEPIEEEIQVEQETPITPVVTPAVESETQEEILESSQDEIAKSPLALEKADVIRVVDGDTIVVRLENGTEERVRFIGVNTPESTTRHEPYGKEASAFTESQLDGKAVYLEKDVSDRDRYDRLLRYVWLDPPTEENESEIRSKLFNAILLLGGYAQVATYPPDVKYTDDYFVKFQTEAREANKGLWGIVTEEETTAISPSFNDITVYVTSTGTKYHRDGCRHLKTRIPISLDKAKASYDPCRVCNPPY